mmetsp:Transcript_6356/g.19204  ORF Transcript_6356/g.19204 Transcript_6356/m.19204 type:complete len:210 (-) Transcript_6356:254-883(-)
MKPAWDQLAEAWKDSSSVLIGEVDCTAAGGDKLCADNGVEGYPTIKYFTEESGRGGYSYSSSRDFETLNSFVEDELHRECNVKTKESCSRKELAYVTKMVDQGQEKWAGEAKRLQGLLDKPTTPEQHDWLLKRHSILEQLLGRRTTKKRRMRFWKKIAIAAAAIVGVILVGFLVLRTGRSGTEAPVAEKADKSEGEAKKQEKEDAAKQD